MAPVKPGLRTALDVTRGDTAIERWMPAAVALATIIVALGACFGFVPGLDVKEGLALLVGSGGGYAIRSQA
jgi:TctA family transporter